MKTMRTKKNFKCYTVVDPKYDYPNRSFQHLDFEERQWKSKNQEYEKNVVSFTHSSVLGIPEKPTWADDEVPTKKRINQILNSLFPVWNNEMNKLEFHKISDICYIDNSGKPLNPLGRTGIRGRGLLGKWGGNLAGDLILARVKHGEIQYVTIVRKDNHQLSTTGGMVDPSDILNNDTQDKLINGLLNAAFREYIEEASADKGEILKELQKYIKTNIQCIDGGICDDVRNTDNAFIGTGVFLALLPDTLADKLQMQYGNEEAFNIGWRTLQQIKNHPTGVFGSHEQYFEKAEIQIKKSMKSKNILNKIIIVFCFMIVAYYQVISVQFPGLSIF